VIEIKNAKNIEGKKVTHFIESKENHIIDASGLTLLPALIDPHVHFRVPGHEHKENWETAAKAAIYGGVTTVFDMPNNTPPCVSFSALQDKKKKIFNQLKSVNIPLRHFFYLGADKAHLHEIESCKDDIIGIKVFMGSSTGGLLIQDNKTLEEVFKIAQKHNLPIAVHAEDEEMIQGNRRQIKGPLSYSDHSLIRGEKAAEKAVHKIVSLVEKYPTKVYILHVSTHGELEIIRKAKQKHLPIYAEATPHHLFLTVDDYKKYGAKAVINPPLRKSIDRDALWEGIKDGTIDCIGSDHAPHTLEEKNKPYGACPSGMPGIETMLPLLLDAYNNNRLTLQEIVSLTHLRIQDIFNLPLIDDVVLADLNLEKRVGHMKTKVGWSCFENKLLKGWPKIVILKGKVFNIE